MPSHLYSIDRASRVIAELQFTAGWKDVTVFYDKEPVGTFSTREEVEAGREFALPDGSLLTVKLPNRVAFAKVSLDGRPLILTGDPEKRVRAAATVTGMVGAVNLLLGIFAVFTEAEFPKRMGANAENIVQGVTFLVFTILIRRYSLVALRMAIALFVWNCGYWLWIQVERGASIPWGAFAVRALFLFSLWGGIVGVRQIKAERAHAKAMEEEFSESA